MKFSNVMSSAGRMAARRRSASSDRHQQPRPAGAQSCATAPFPAGRKRRSALQILELIKPRVEELPEMQDSFSELLQDLSALEKQVLVERHLISREHAAKSVGSAVVMNRRQTLSIMINEEDHLRMQSIRSGLQLRSAFKLVDKVDSTLEGKARLRFRPAARLSHRLPDQRRHRHARLGHAASARPRPERADQPGHPGREQNRPRGSRSLRRRHRSDGQSFPDFQPDDARRKGGRNHRPADQSDRNDHRERTRRAADVDPEEIRTRCGTRSAGHTACLPMRMR